MRKTFFPEYSRKISFLIILGGWKNMEMVLRYAHLSPGHLAEWAGNATVQPQLRLVANR